MATPPLTMYRKIASVFVLLTIVLVFIIFYYSLTYAYITIIPEKQDAQLTFTALITENDDAVDMQKGIFEGVLIDREVTQTQSFAATSTKTVQLDARGTVTLINTSDRPQPLVATTRLLTESEDLFRISETVSVPANGEVEVAYYQDNPQAAVDLVVGQRLTIPGLNEARQQEVYAELTNPPTGESVEITYASKEDLDAAIDEVVTMMEEEIRETIPDNSLVVLETEVESAEFDVVSGEETDRFTVTVTAQVQGVFFDAQNVEQFASHMLINSLQSDVELLSEDAIATQLAIDLIDTDNELVQLDGTVVAPVILRKNSSLLQKDNLTGLSLQEAEAYLENLDFVVDAQVTFFPFWVKKIPSFKDHIVITIEP
jgi:hypothetical protein